MFLTRKKNRARQPPELITSKPYEELAPSPNSPSTVESSTLYNESDKNYSHHRSTASVSKTSVSSGRRSPSFSDFGGYHSQRKGSNQQTTRPASRSTDLSTNTRPITIDSPSRHHDSTHTGIALHASQHDMQVEEFYFPRPNDDEDIEALFREIKRSLDLGDNMPYMTIYQKWQMVYNAEHLRWSEERRLEQQTKKQAETGQSDVFVEGSPEWYIQRFMDRTITPKQSSSLEVSLRSNQLRSTVLYRSPPSVAQEFLAGLSTLSGYKVLPCLHKLSHRYQGREARGSKGSHITFCRYAESSF